jgi:hypothetical protein
MVRRPRRRARASVPPAPRRHRPSQTAGTGAHGPGRRTAVTGRPGPGEIIISETLLQQSRS